MDAQPGRPSRFRFWWTYERGSDHWASLVALGLGVVGLVAVLLF
jgi:hypothetical protein